VWEGEDHLRERKDDLQVRPGAFGKKGVKQQGGRGRKGSNGEEVENEGSCYLLWNPTSHRGTREKTGDLLSLHKEKQKKKKRGGVPGEITRESQAQDWGKPKDA